MAYNKFTIKQTKTVFKNQKDDDIKPIKTINIIDHFYVNDDCSNSKRTINSINIDELISNSGSLSFEDKRAVDNKVNEHILLFKKCDLNKALFPCLNTYYSQLLEEALIQYNDNKSKLLYYVLRLIEILPSFENKLFDFYLSLITKTSFGLTKTMKEKISKNVIASNEFTLFCKRYAQWHSESEIIIFTINLLDLAFGIKFQFDSEKFSLQKNLTWSPLVYAKRNFTELSSIFLRNANIGLKIFGSVNYSKFLMMILSNYYSGMSIPAIFWASKIHNYALVGTYAFNCIVTYIADYLDHYSKTIDFSSMKGLLEDLNNKLEKVRFALVELLKLKIVENMSGLEIISNKEDAISYESDKNNKLITKKIDEKILLITKHLNQLQDISPEDEKQIDLETIAWVEKSINLTSINENGVEEQINEKAHESNNYWTYISIIKDK